MKIWFMKLLLTWCISLLCVTLLYCTLLSYNKIVNLFLNVSTRITIIAYNIKELEIYVNLIYFVICLINRNHHHHHHHQHCQIGGNQNLYPLHLVVVVIIISYLTSSRRYYQSQSFHLKMNLKDPFSFIKNALFMMAIESCLTLILSKVDVFENLIPY